MPKIDRPTHKVPTAIGAYIFAGGFTVGVAKHFQVLAHLEGSDYGVEVFKKNYPTVPVVIGADDWADDELPSKCFAGGVDFIYGNPPCAAWSGNNPNSHRKDGTGWEKDPRVNCTRTHFGLLARFRPKVWAWESVCQAPDKGKPLVDQLTKEAIDNGYSVTYLFHDAMYLGTAQTRKRWFMVCSRVEFTPEPPDFRKIISAVDCLKKVKPRATPAYDSGRFQQLFEHKLHMLPAGSRLRKFWELLNPPETRELKPNGHTKGRVGLGHVRLKDVGPASATVGYSMVHPTEHRFLHMNEIQALAGFPQSFDFGGKGTYAAELDLVARGVCPPVGEWLARSVKASILRNVKVKTPTVTLYDFRKPNIDPVDLTPEFV
jgi:DNA (cytosine-5)-methyltransferase 1